MIERVQLLQVHLDYCERMARRRRGNAKTVGLKSHNNAPTDEVETLRMDRYGMFGECAGFLYLRETKPVWHVFREGRDFVEPDLEIGALKIDMKCRVEGWHDLIVQKNDQPSWVFAFACSLSDILETGEVPQRYFLSPRACAGILRRAAKRGKDLPRQLQAALQAGADSAPTLIATAA